jgi:hypothetical protein
MTPFLLAIQESQGERGEDEDDTDVHHQPFPEHGPEEQNIHGDHDGHQQNDDDRRNI